MPLKKCTPSSQFHSHNLRQFHLAFLLAWWLSISLLVSRALLTRSVQCLIGVWCRFVKLLERRLLITILTGGSLLPSDSWHAWAHHWVKKCYKNNVCRRDVFIHLPPNWCQGSCFFFHCPRTHSRPTRCWLAKQHQLRLVGSIHDLSSTTQAF